MDFFDDRLFLQGLKELGLCITQEQLEKFHLYYRLMVEKNQVMNLTAITEYNDVVVKHWLDSLCICKAADAQKEIKVLLESEAVRMIDVGTGAGFPGIPIKILFPTIRLTLLDSLKKRVLFLQDVVEQLELAHVSCIHGRAEELGRTKEHREQYDVCVSRAVAKLSSLSEFCLPFVKEGGFFLSYKTEEAKEEIERAQRAIKELGAVTENRLSFMVPCSDYRRILPIVKKTRKTPDRYPRGGGKPLKAPLE